MTRDVLPGGLGITEALVLMVVAVAVFVFWALVITVVRIVVRPWFLWLLRPRRRR